jgi:predicted NBD/HSP70 family sugar kinase
MIGLELRDQAAVAVGLDDRGAVLARAERPAAGDLGAAVLEAFERVVTADCSVVGVASASPESEAVGRALRLVRGRYAGALVDTRIVASGMAAAVAEAWIGAARDASDVVYLAVADHASAGIIGGGSPVVGAHGRAAAVAWLALNPVEREDYRKVGCLDAEVAAAGIVRRLVWRIKAGDRSKIQDVVNNDLSAITVGHVLDAAQGGDGVAISVMRDTARYVGMAAANLVVMADPQTLVLGGIIASAPNVLFDLVKAEMRRRLSEPMMTALTIVPALLGAAAAAIGAARLMAHRD